MCFYEYVEYKYEGNKDVAEFTVYEAGMMPFEEVFPAAILLDIDPADSKEDYDHLPYQYIDNYVCQERCCCKAWVCQFCSFWCDIYDQRIMENHLCCNCTKVNYFLLF
jgi:hypothetical protein